MDLNAILKIKFWTKNWTDSLKLEKWVRSVQKYFILNPKFIILILLIILTKNTHNTT